MALVRMGSAAFDLSEVTGVVPKRGKAARVAVYLRNAACIELGGDEARAFIELIESLPARDDLGPVGSRVGVPSVDKPHFGEPPGRKKQG